MNNESPFWTAFGKFSAVITTIAALVGIWVFITQEHEDLELYVDAQSYITSPDLKNKISEHFSFYSRDNLKELLKNTSLPNELIENKYELVNFVMELQAKSWGMDILYTPYQPPIYEGYNYLKLSNTGDKIATEIAIDFPEKGIALVINPDKSIKTIKFNRVINVDDLRAANDIIVLIWSENMLSKYDYEKINVTHKNGIGEVTWAIEATGISWYVQNHPYFTALCMYLIFILGMVFSSLTGNKDQTSRSA